MINETFFHPETGVFNAVTGGAYNLPFYGAIVRGSVFPSIGTIPIAVTYVGTMKSTGKNVRGTGTQFTKIIQGSYLYAGNVVREVDYVVSDTLLVLKQAFPSDLSVDTAVKVCERQYFKMIVAKNTHASAAAILQEAPFAAGRVLVGGGAPMSYDATYGEISFDVHQ